MPIKARPLFIILLSNIIIIYLLVLSNTYIDSDRLLSSGLRGIAILTSMNVAIFLSLKRNRRIAILGPRKTYLVNNKAIFQPLTLVNHGSFSIGNITMRTNKAGILTDYIWADENNPSSFKEPGVPVLSPNSNTDPFYIEVKILDEQLIQNSINEIILKVSYYFSTFPEKEQTEEIKLIILSH